MLVYIPYMDPMGILPDDMSETMSLQMAPPPRWRAPNSAARNSSHHLRSVFETRWSEKLGMPHIMFVFEHYIYTHMYIYIICVRIYIYNMCMYIYIYVYIYICIYIYIYMCVCIFICMCIYIPPVQFLHCRYCLEWHLIEILKKQKTWRIYILYILWIFCVHIYIYI